MSRPFRFGVSVRHAGSRQEWQEKARRAEAYGYSIFLVPDHVADILPPIAALTSAADATTTLRVGTFVLNNDLRHPVLVAREAAAIDLLSDGRFELGVGAGHMASEYRRLGVPFEDNRTRSERLAEAVAIVKPLLGGEEVTFSGVHYQVAGQRIHPAPVQEPRPPLLIGGNSRNVLALAGRQADIVSFLGFSHRRGGTEFDPAAFTHSGTEERVEIVREAAGDRFRELELNAVVQRVTVTDRRRAVAEEIAGDNGLSADDALASPYFLLGSVDEIAEALIEGRERHGFSYIAVFEPALETFAPVVERLSGT
jgi:probable F420-dependent oxidoreductase